MTAREVRRLVLTGATALALGLGLGQASRPAANVGGHNVPSGLHCQEDERVGVPRSSDGPAICIHISEEGDQ